MRDLRGGADEAPVAVAAVLRYRDRSSAHAPRRVAADAMAPSVVAADTAGSGRSGRRPHTVINGGQPFVSQRETLSNLCGGLLTVTRGAGRPDSAE